MTARNKQIVRQEALVDRLGRRLYFELLVLQRLRLREGSNALAEPSAGPATLAAVLAAAQERRRLALASIGRAPTDNPPGGS